MSSETLSTAELTLLTSIFPDWYSLSANYDITSDTWIELPHSVPVYRMIFQVGRDRRERFSYRVFKIELVCRCAFYCAIHHALERRNSGQCCVA